jgi:hypothetical protein
MSLYLRNTVVSAAYCPTCSVNALSRAWACAHEVEPERSAISLSVTVAFPYQVVTSSFDFVILDSLEFDVVFCLEWDSWCKENNGASLLCIPFFFLIRIF